MSDDVASSDEEPVAINRQLHANNVQTGSQQAYVEAITDLLREPMLVLDTDLRVISANRAFCHSFETTPKLVRHALLHEVGDRQLDIPELRNLLEGMVSARTTIESFEVRHDFAGGERSMLLKARRLRQAEGQRPQILLAFEDVTEHPGAEAMLRERAERQNLLLQVSDALQPLEDVCEIEATVTQKVLEHFAADRCCYCEIEAGNAIIRRDAAGGALASAAGTHPLDSSPLYKGAVDAGAPFVEADVRTGDPADEALQRHCARLRIVSFLGVPVKRDGQVVGLLFLMQRAARRWTDAEAKLAGEIAERTAAAMRRARNEATLLDREQRLRLALGAAGIGSFVWYPQDDRSEPDAQMLALFGQPPDGTLDIAAAFAGVIHPDDHERFAVAIADAIDPTGDGKLSEEIRVAVPGARQRWLSMRAQVQFEGDPPRAVRMPGIARDISERKRRELDLAFLADTSEDLVRMFNIQATMNTLGVKIGAHFNASACVFGEVDDEEQFITVTSEWKRADVPSLVGKRRISDFHGEIFRMACRSGETYVVRDAAADSQVDSDTMAAFSIGSLVSVPLLREGRWRFQVILTDSAPRDWRDDEINLLRELAMRIWTRLERARAEQALGESEARYRTLFNSIDEGFCIVEMLYDADDNAVDWRFMEVNPAFRRTTGLADVKGKTIKQLVPGIERRWLELFERVAATGEPLRFEQRSRSMQRWFDVYAFRVGGTDRSRVAILISDITLRKQEERATVRLASIVDSSDDAIISKNLEGVVATWNRGAERMFGYTAQEAIGQPISALIIPDDRQAEEADILRRVAVGQSIDHFETVRRRKNGSTLDVSETISPLMHDGRVVGASKIARDISERKRAEQHRDMLIHELNHRVKNTLAIMQSLAAQTFRGVEMRDALANFDARLLALSAATDVLTRERWQGAEIREIVGNAVAAWSSGPTERIHLGGPELRLRPEAALALAMALHELATNASKYGALSGERGRVAIFWSLAASNSYGFRLQWRESDGPPVRPPARRGFGSRLVEQGLAQDLGGTVQLSFNVSGVECVIEAPLDEISEEGSAP